MRSLNHKTVAYLARAGIVAAMYALLTCVWPFSLGPIQCRVSEALCVLPYYMGAAVPGLFIGCLLGNLLSGAMALDVLFGSLATLLGALCTWLLGKYKKPAFLAPLPPVLFNAVIVGILLTYVYSYGLTLPVAMVQVGGGEALSCYILGLPLLAAMKKYPQLYQ